MGKHSVLSPSGASRWTLCHGSLAVCKDLPEDRASDDAALGTAKHGISEICLVEDREPETFLGDVVRVDGHNFTLDEDMLADVRSYVDGIRRIPGERYVEVRLDTSYVLQVPDQTGTSDAVVANVEEGILDVADAKFGYERIMAKGNKQGIIYIAAALEMLETLMGYKFEKARFSIHQPKIDHYDEHTYTMDEIELAMRDIRAAAASAMDMYWGRKPIVLTPGPVQCKWCPVRGSCKARRAEMLDMFPVDAEEPEPVMLSNEEIAATLERVDDIARWCNDIKAEAYKRAITGMHIPGHKLIRGKRGNRFWKDPASALFALEQLLDQEQLFKPREIISPTDADKLLKVKYQDLKPFVGQNDGALFLVPEATPKEEVKVESLEFEPVAE